MSKVRVRYRLKLPEPVERSYVPFVIDEPGTWLNVSDLHIPYHDTKTIELAIAVARKRRANVLLNGDVLDYHEMSDFDRDPGAPRYVAERAAGLAFFAYLRERLPAARIIYKAGNHEERLDRYVMRRAPALFGLQAVQLQNIMELDNYGIEYVGDRRVVRQGRLNVLHGHEYKPNLRNPVNPARGLALRAKTNAMCAHFHQTSEHHEPTLDGKPKGCWSVGCACGLSPFWMPLNKWNHGFAMTEIGSGGTFSVQNLRVLNGEVI